MALKVSRDSYTRPADTTTYAAGDIFSDSTTEGEYLTFENVVRATNGHGKIAMATLVDTSNQTVKGDFELWLFNTAPAVVNDNAAAALTEEELEDLVTVIKFPVASALISNPASADAGNVTYFGQPASGVDDAIVFTKKSSRDLYGIVIVRNAYVPLASSSLTFTLHFE